jgi:UDP-N-acetylmuramyl pentapeptide synthase
MLMPGDTVLFKASRAMRLEEISGALARSMMQAG